MMKYQTVNSILSKLKTKDPYFGIDYNMNLYRGCQHACIYCDTRSDCYGMSDISQITVKTNALELLNKALSSKRQQKFTIGTGSMNDPYMPVEKEIQLTRRALEIISRYKYPVHIITKSALVQRDVDILTELSKTYLAASFTITTPDDNLSKIIEPNASISSERFQAMSVLAQNGIYTGITLMPVLPFITDTIPNLEDLMKKAKDNGAAYVFPMFGVTLRKGSRDYFYKALDMYFPGVKKQYQEAFNNSYECFSSNYQALWDTFENLSAKLSLEKRIRFYEPPLDAQLSLF